MAGLWSLSSDFSFQICLHALLSCGNGGRNPAPCCAGGVRVAGPPQLLLLLDTSGEVWWAGSTGAWVLGEDRFPQEWGPYLTSPRTPHGRQIPESRARCAPCGPMSLGVEEKLLLPKFPKHYSAAAPTTPSVPAPCAARGMAFSPGTEGRSGTER